MIITLRGSIVLSATLSFMGTAFLIFAVPQLMQYWMQLPFRLRMDR